MVKAFQVKLLVSRALASAMVSQRAQACVVGGGFQNQGFSALRAARLTDGPRWGCRMSCLLKLQVQGGIKKIQE